MKVTVQVTEDDVLLGMRKSNVSCPIALALKRAVGPLTTGDAQVSVGKVTAGFYPSLGACRMSTYLSREARAFVEAFDGGQAVGPATFEMTFEEDPVYTQYLEGGPAAVGLAQQQPAPQGE